MKVLSILPETKNPSGMVFAKRQIELLSTLGVENRTFIFPSTELTFRKLINNGIRLRKEVRSFHPDIVHVHYGLIYAFAAAFFQGHRLIITFQGSDINNIASRSRFRNIFNHFLSNMAVLRAGTVICVSRNVSGNLWWGHKKTVIIPPGIDMDLFKPMDRQICREKLNWPASEKVILFNANNPAVKRIDIAEKTILLLKEQIPGARLEILRGIITDDNQIPVIINASDCLLICSDSEGSPTMVKEAMACNIPVVGVDVGDVKERLRNVNGSSVVGKDPAVLANAIAGVLREGKSSEGRKKLLSDGLSDTMVAQKILRLYRFRTEKHHFRKRNFGW
ncbi:MAG: glycosyltransferase [Bacteroidota bacterium]|nr:glycosyltransferase [Bacteroidota bacterium]